MRKAPTDSSRSSGSREARTPAFCCSAITPATLCPGLFVDELTIEGRSVEELRRLAESGAGRALSPSGAEVALAPDEIEKRFLAGNASPRAAPASAIVEYRRALARLAWRRSAFEEVVAGLAPLSARGALRWPDFMRLVGAYAAMGRWEAAHDELRTQRTHWQAAPELLYMEAVALVRLRDETGSVRHCHAALESTRGTRHPERAYWAARACLVPAAVASGDVADIENLIALANPGMSGTLGQAELRGALLLRRGRWQEAFDLLESTVPRQATVRAAVLFVASAAARSGSSDTNWQAIAAGGWFTVGLRTDGTMVESNIHAPSDNRFLADGVRVLARTVVRAQKLVKQVVQETFEDFTQTAKQLARQIGETLRKKTDAAKSAGRQQYQELLEITRQTVEWARHTQKQLHRHQEQKTIRLVRILETFLPRTQQVIEQTTQRILQGKQLYCFLRS